MPAHTSTRESAKSQASTPAIVAFVLLLAFSAAAPAQTADWPTYNGNVEGTRYSPLTQITPANAARLQQVCQFDTHEQVGQQAGPIVVAGTLYVTTDTSTYALDARDCSVKWRNHRAYAPLSLYLNNHGAVFMDGCLFRVAGDVHAYSLDAASGKILWDVAFGDTARGESAPMAPLAWNGLVFVGNAGGDILGVRGHVNALDARTGKLVHQSDTGAPLGAGIITYAVGGRQYIAVVGGSISPLWPLPKATSRVTVYSLP